MAETPHEIEVKFFVTDPATLLGKLVALGATLEAPRVFEVNLRFDTPDYNLTKLHSALRLRSDSRARLTYKSAADLSQGVSSRREIEFEVSNFDEARAFLEALGYKVMIAYEKYRTTYRLGAVLVTLDEMPFGLFAEVEGPDAETIQRVAKDVGLDWEARSVESYLALFDRLKRRRGLTTRNLTFAEFPAGKYTPDDFFP